MVEAILVLCFSLLFFCSNAEVSPGSSNAATDELALLAFKSMLSSHSDELLATWNASSHYCSWPGVVCSRRHSGRVVALRIESFNLSGSISPALGNLSLLRELDLGDNQLTGEMPSEIGQLRRLQVLNLSTNHLQGSIPVTVGECAELITIDLGSNQLQGEIPAELGALKNLVRLSLHQNGLSGEIPQSLSDLVSIEFLSLRDSKLSGEIPHSLGNLTNLRHLHLQGNMLTGVIPASFGMLSRLSFLALGYNNLSGPIPASFWNISSLTIISVQQNMLNGTIPPNAFSKLPYLQKVYMDNNQFHGHLPASLGNCSKLTWLQLGFNFFNGIVPHELGQLKKLGWLQLSVTLLEAKDPKDWEFITALTNCSDLQLLGLESCRFGGVLPDSISNLSTSLLDLVLSQNAISGHIPLDIGNLINLQVLALSENSLTGTLPSSLGSLKDLREFSAYYNKLSGTIPSNVGNLTELNLFGVDVNALSGEIPSTLGNLTKLVGLDLSVNNFIGRIPSTIFNIRTLSRGLDLSENNLEGSIPVEIGNLINMVGFDGSSNKLSGEIPNSLGECQLLQNLYLNNNLLHGSIPSILGQLKGLETLDLSSNNFSGQIPTFLGNLSMLYYLNLSFNSFSGEVPNFGVFTNASGISIQGNDKLCGGIPDMHLPPCSLTSPEKKHNFIVIPIVVCLIATISILFLLYKFHNCRNKGETRDPTATPLQGHPLITYSQLVGATDAFSSRNLLGSGAFGSVFKGNMGAQAVEGTNLVAVKVLKLETPGALKTFVAECEVLRSLRHRNLVKIITACSSIDTRGNDFKAIVFEFMPNGSLDGWLHHATNDQTEQKYLNLLERVTILLDVAYALDYLHCHGPEPVAHCDLKSSNVLLDADMVARVGDFGLAKILVQGSSSFHQSTSSMGFRGTIGYAAPEYGVGNTVSTNGDIFSYGILVLETITGKRPSYGGFRQGSSIREYVKLGLHNQVMDIVDIRLSSDLKNGLRTMSGSSYESKIDCLASLLRLGLSCSEETPSSRMPTGDIIRELRATKELVSVLGNAKREDARTELS
ncbi:unnamed protein product [Alopecurus aequalis]